MYADYKLCDMPLSLRSNKEAIAAMLAGNGLTYDDLDAYIGIFSSKEELIGGGGIKDNIIKCVAIDKDARNENLTNSLISRLRCIALEKGFTNIFIFTKPDNEDIFRSLAFYTVGRCNDAILMESNPRGISSYAQNLSEMKRKGRNGIIVMNCNPLTLGHLFIIKKAASMTDTLYVMIVQEDKSEYSAKERLAMAKEATRTLQNVIVTGTGDYSVSYKTFPAYFIKKSSDAANAQMQLDIDIFNRHIAPALDIETRFVGTEPNDALTNEYNMLMKKQLNVKLVEIERLRIDDTLVSASKIRHLTISEMAGKAIKMIPASTIPYVLAHCATHSLRTELELTPKPGLVDSRNSGAHTDMDFKTMSRSIDTLQPFYTQLAKVGMFSECPEAEHIRAIGTEAEFAMMNATNGVNTHKGALFSIGITLVAASQCIRQTGRVSPHDLKENIILIAHRFCGGKGTHGESVRKKYSIPTAIDNAKSGYHQMFSSWLPFYHETKDDDHSKHKLLLKIMSEIEDSNVYHRGGKDTAQYVKDTSKSLLCGFSTGRLKECDDTFIRMRISPGGAADMLALTLLTYSLTYNLKFNNND